MAARSVCTAAVQTCCGQVEDNAVVMKSLKTFFKNYLCISAQQLSNKEVEWIEGEKGGVTRAEGGERRKRESKRERERVREREGKRRRESQRNHPHVYSCLSVF